MQSRIPRKAVPSWEDVENDSWKLCFLQPRRSLAEISDVRSMPEVHVGTYEIEYDVATETD